MKYKELWIPVLIFFALAPIIVSVKPDSEITQFIFSLLSVSIVIYYLRWSNSGTPLINTLTVCLVVLYEGLYIMDKYPVYGKIAVLAGGIGFGISFLIRVWMKTAEEKAGRVTLLKMACVILYVAGEIVYVLNYPKYIELHIAGVLVLSSGYFYDRFRNYDKILENTRDS